MEVGIFDPQEPTGGTGTSFFETSVPMFQGEVTYNTKFQGGDVMVWASGLWQEMDVIPSGFANDTITSWGINLGGSVGFSGFEVVGSWYTGQALGTDLFMAGGGGFGGAAVGSAGLSGIASAPGFMCSGGTFAPPTCDEADNDGWYVQGSYTFNGKTKIAGSYGESNQSDSAFSFSDGVHFNDVNHTMWTIGVYHDVTSWLKLVAEYNDQEQTADLSKGFIFGTPEINSVDAQTFSVGGFIFW